MKRIADELQTEKKNYLNLKEDYKRAHQVYQEKIRGIEEFKAQSSKITIEMTEEIAGLN